MASAPHFTLSPILSLFKNLTYKPQNFLPSTSKQSTVKIRASGTDLLGDFGARDPFPVEIESNFAEKVLGNVSTEHKILIPIASALSLAQQECIPVSQLQQHMSEDAAKTLLLKVVGWRLVNEEGVLKLQGLWKVRDAKSVESTGHLPTLHFDAPYQVKAELWTSSIGGLSLNDFIVAAKIDEIKVSDLQPRQRVWA
ncbi:Pterin carbinolamine dehydratase PCBD/dimerization cofactor of HNF1 [Handroanthus impetiginosus]|uniref:4a-hydroxytetrahydrobiopterin dehydratase n=1 Tax=Handroanthus impetiginosus TaxID=429701 RepID=A0A2G9IAY3_9LAMI|nr:Pterin carbinolamine dehydratase PCBD/dimerization cofactor of HNF1 [Handroanthus impetiginosus]